jgi:hypothetical protein
MNATDLKKHPSYQFVTQGRDPELVIAIKHRDELMPKDKLAEDLTVWMAEYTPQADWTYINSGGEWLVFAFKKPQHVVHFKLRWWE